MEKQKQAALPLVALASSESTNLYAKQHAAQHRGLWAVYTTDQTAGRGRLGRAWANAAGQGLYYTVVLDGQPAQPETLSQLASLVTARALAEQYGVHCRIKWPNDLLLDGKKLVGILCESTQLPGGDRVWLAGIGINLAQPQAYFDAAGLPHATSLALAGVPVEVAAQAPALAARLTAGFAAMAPEFVRAGFAPLRAAYRAACVNLGRPVQFPAAGGTTGHGVAEDVDEKGRLVVKTADGTQKVFSGEVSVGGIYGFLGAAD